MHSRIASMVLVLLTIGFFLLHFWWKKSEGLQFVDAISPIPDTEASIVHNEFLILMDEGDEKRLSEVLSEFDLTVITPLGEWVHVAKKESYGTQTITPLRSLLAKEDISFAKRLEENDAVHTVQLNYVQNTDAGMGCADFGNGKALSEVVRLPRDPMFRYQWHLSAEMGVDLPGAWSITTGNEATVIALVDRNFDFSENDFNMDHCGSRKYYYENVLDYFPQKPVFSSAHNDNHGSQVLSVIAPCTDNDEGLAGVDWRAQVFAVDSKDNATFSARMFGILWASGLDVCTKSIASCPEHSAFQRNLHPANIINTSFGFAGDYLLDPPYGPVLDVISRINRQGRIVVASAGNEGQVADRRLPGAAGGVISVGASNKLHQGSYFSNVGRTVDVNAPGEDIVGIKKNKPIMLNGTSFSSPIVAGIVSLMLSANPLLSWKHVEYILKKTASPMSCSDYCPSTMIGMTEQACRDYCCVGEQNFCSSGIVNAKAAVAMAKLGFPSVVLVDVDDYFIALSDDSGWSTKITIKNWGKKRGRMRMRMTNKYLKMWPEMVLVEPISDDGVPGSALATIYYDDKPKDEKVLSLIIEASDDGTPDNFYDRIEAIVSIVPDPPRSKRKTLEDILPKK